MKRSCGFILVVLVAPFAIGTLAGAGVLKAMGSSAVMSTEPPVARISPFEAQFSTNAYDFYRSAAETAEQVPQVGAHLSHAVFAHRVSLCAYTSEARAVARRVLNAAYARRSFPGDEPLDGSRFYRVIDVVEDVAYADLYRGKSRDAARWALATLNMAREVESTTGTPVFTDYALPKMDSLIGKLLVDPYLGERSLRQLADGYSKIVPSGLSSMLVSI